MRFGIKNGTAAAVMMVVGCLLVPSLVDASDPLPPVSAENEGLVVWAVAAEIVRGPVDVTVPLGAVASFGSEADVVGVADSVIGDPYPVASLGDGGIATLRFSVPVSDGAGADLAVFENAFDESYLELAHVEVSSDGLHFIRFPSVSTTQTATQIAGLQSGGIDPEDLLNLAGKYSAGVGTPFDLAVLRGTSPWLDVSRITHVRVIDVIGSVDPAFGSRDSLGNLINDPWKTNFTTGGFDLDAVGAFYPAPTTHSAWVGHHFPSGGMSDDDEDPDRDGIANLIEYVVGSDPLFFSAPPLRLVQDGGEDVVRWARARERGGMNVVLQVGEGLTGWNTLTSAIGTADVSTSVGGVTVEESVESSEVITSFATSGGKNFFRLEVTR